MSEHNFTDGKLQHQLDKLTRKAIVETTDRLWYIENSNVPQSVKDKAEALSDVLEDYFHHSRKQRREAESR